MQGVVACARAAPRAARRTAGRRAQPHATCAAPAVARPARQRLQRQRTAAAPTLHAVRKGTPASAEGEMDAASAASWAAFAEADVPDVLRDPSDDALTPEFKAAVNLMCNRSLKAMLKDDRAEVAELRGEVAALVQHFSGAGADPSTARFLRVVLALLNSQLPEQGELLRLREDYALAFDSMWVLLEDAGWALLPASSEDN